MNPVALLIPNRIWIETHDRAMNDSCDVIVEMEDGLVYTAMFVTLPYLERQMRLSYDMCKSLPDVPAVQYATLETPHIIVPDLSREVIDDTIDNLLALDTFSTLFTQVSDFEEDFPMPSTSGKRATAEVAAVVINEVLVCEGDILPFATAATDMTPAR
jgi:hypothetical protein